MEHNKYSFLFVCLFFYEYNDILLTTYVVVKLLWLDIDYTSKYGVHFFQLMPFTNNHVIVFVSHYFRNVVLIVPKVIIQAVTQWSVTSEPVCIKWGKHWTFSNSVDLIFLALVYFFPTVIDV